MRNTYPGICYRCKKKVETRQGHFELIPKEERVKTIYRFQKIKWRLQHTECAIKYRELKILKREQKILEKEKRG